MTSNPRIRETAHPLYKRQKDRGVHPSEASSHGAGFRAQATKQESCAHTITRLGLNMANRQKKFFSKKIQKVGAGHRDQRRNNFIFFFNLEASSRRSITVQAYDRATTCGLGGDGLDVASPLCAEVAQVGV